MSVTFRPTGRTRLLMALVLLAGLIGAAVLWWSLSRRPPPAPAASGAGPSAAVQRALTQLEARTGRPMQMAYAAEQPGGIVCGYAGFRPPAGSRRPLSVAPFVAFPDRVALPRDDRAGFRRLMDAHCPNFPTGEAA